MFWELWCEGSLDGEVQPTKLNFEPIEAKSMNQAIAKLAKRHPDRESFVESEIGWTYRGCMIFDTERAARVSSKRRH